MRIKFLTVCEIEVCQSFDAALDDLETEARTFQIGEEIEFEIIDHPQRFNGKKFVDDTKTVNVQFPNGNVAFGLSYSWFEKLS